MSFGCEIYHRVCGGQDRLRGAIVAVECDDAGGRV